MNISLKLTVAGIDTGPFNLFSNVDGYTTPFEVGVSRNDLLATYETSNAPNGTTIVRITSTGSCSNSINVTLEQLTTTTTTTEQSTTTTTTTEQPATTTTTTTVGLCSFTIYFDINATPNPSGWESQETACSGTGTPLTVYTTGPTCPEDAYSAFISGKALYLDSGLSNPLNGNNTWFKTAPNSIEGRVFIVGTDGFIQQFADINCDGS